MPKRFEIIELLQDAAPGSLCKKCIGDRMSLFARRYLVADLENLKAPDVERLTGECASCLQVTEVIRAL